MAPRKRKHSQDASLARPAPVPPVTTTHRPPTRQKPDVDNCDVETVAEEHKLRSGRRVRVNKNNTGEASAAAKQKRVVSRPRKRDASAEVEHPTIAVKTRQRVGSEPGDAMITVLPPPPPPPPSPPVTRDEVSPLRSSADDRRQRPPKKARNDALHHSGGTGPDPTPRKRSRPHTYSLQKPRDGVASPSTPHRLVARPSRQQRPIPAATGSGPAGTTALALTPSRTPHSGGGGGGGGFSTQTPRPPGTPHSDRNIDTVVFGTVCFKAWYPSYYGKEVDPGAGAGGGGGGAKRDPRLLDRLYVCPCCFKYSKELLPWWKHVGNCEKRAHVPGRKIYTHPRRLPANTRTAKGGRGTHGRVSEGNNNEVVNEGEWSVWEVDGEKEGLFCQNLSLFAKLFLDNKSVFFDVSGFNYFLLVYTPPSPPTPPASPPIPPPASGTTSSSLEHGPKRPQIVGFFSKEKISWDNNNLACILIFPPWQRKGLGPLLMGISYEISRREGVLGGPEKPISELGRRGYGRFWAGEIARWVLELPVQSQSSACRHSSAGDGYSIKREEKEDVDGVGGEREKSADKDSLVVDIAQCSRETWIVAEDCLAVMKEMGVIEDAGLGRLPRGNRDLRPQPTNNGNASGSRSTSTGEDDEMTDPDKGVQGTGIKEMKERRLMPTVRIDKAAVRAWVRDNGVDLSRACDPNGFVSGYAVKRVGEEEE
ncbi:acyl-CoA N-acyltransferase [Xylariaceae sp. FL0594]|nr:acyl-CoA N-acyltransferase [Xylariaceae sp. FL0594]